MEGVKHEGENLKERRDGWSEFKRCGKE
jgi:hypothetical protein